MIRDAAADEIIWLERSERFRMAPVADPGSAIVLNTTSHLLAYTRISGNGIANALLLPDCDSEANAKVHLIL
jgi:hypothetical protein